MTATVKPGIPPVPRNGEDRSRFDAAVKEALEVIMGRRGSYIDPQYKKPYVWKDQLTDIIARATGAGNPSFSEFRAASGSADALYGYKFTAGDKVHGHFHIPHDWAIGTKVYLHNHWSTIAATVGNAVWRWTWSYAPGYGIAGMSTPAYFEVTQAHCGIAFGHNIAEASDAQAIELPQGEIDGIIQWTLKLVSVTNAIEPFCFFADMHYQSDERNTLERNRLFTKLSYENDMVDKFNEFLQVVQR